MTTDSPTASFALSGGVDVHAHLFSTSFFAEVAKVREEFGSTPILDRFGTGGAAGFPPELTDPGSQRQALMDQAGVAVQVQSYSTPHLYHPIDEARTRIARAWNDTTSEAVAASAGRLAFFATLPLPLVDASLAEIDRAKTLPGCVGFGLPTHVDGRGLDDPTFRPLFDRLNHSAEVVFLHPDGFCVRGVLADYGMEWSIGAPFEDTIAALRLVMSGTLARCPDLRVVVPHLGGTLPFLLSRIDLHWSRASSPAESTAPSSGIRRLYLDTAQSTPAMLSLAAETVGADHLVFGTDFPYVNRTDFRPPANDLKSLGESAAMAVFRSHGLGLPI